MGPSAQGPEHPYPAIACENESVSFLKSHPVWTLLIVWVVFSLLSYVLFVRGGHGSGGLNVGPIQH